ncbi:uncharacterized protein [Clytia hemisphaerica]|uniref:Uncharacterized protein n=1 Tax=Clytia hemisphaerica TaxID=252671 RepID=A0A7M6DR51_9CNID
MLRGSSDAAVNTLRFIVNPVPKRIANVYLIIVLRVITLLLIFSSCVINTLALILRPWRLNVFRGDQMEIGVWTICRITKKFYQCYDDWYENHYEPWFFAWRWLQVTTSIILMVTFCYICVEMARKRNFDVPWLRGSLGCSVAGGLHFCSFILFYYKFEWEFAEADFGWPIMGWNEETPDTDGYIETTGFPYIMAWVGEILMYISAYLCFYTKCQEIAHLKETKKQREKDIIMKRIAEATN